METLKKWRKKIQTPTGLFYIVVLIVIVFGGLYLILAGFSHTGDRGHSDSYIVQLNAFFLILITAIIARIAHTQLKAMNDASQGMGETSKTDLLLRIDRRYCSEENVKAKAIIHQLYAKEKKAHEEKGKPERIKDVSEKIMAMRLETDEKSTKDFAYLVNFVDFLETVAYFCNKDFIDSCDVKSLTGESIEYYYKIFEKWIKHCEGKYGSLKKFANMEWSNMQENINEFVSECLKKQDYHCQIEKNPHKDSCGFLTHIDAPQKNKSRPNKRSKKLIFHFTEEFVEDKVLDNESIRNAIEQKILEIFKTFDFKNDTISRHESQPYVRYSIDQMGNITEEKTD